MLGSQEKMWISTLKNHGSFSNIGQKAFPLTHILPSEKSHKIFLYKTLIFLSNRKAKPSLSIILLLKSQDLLLPTFRSSAPCCVTTNWMILSTNIDTLNSYHSHLPPPLRWQDEVSRKGRQAGYLQPLSASTISQVLIIMALSH